MVLKRMLRRMGKVSLVALTLWAAASAAPLRADTPPESLETIFQEHIRSLGVLFGQALDRNSWESVRGETLEVTLKTRRRIGAFLSSGGRDQMMQADKTGTPAWMVPVVFGVPELLEVFLEYPEVRDLADKPLKIFGRDTYPWAIATAAPFQSIHWCGGPYEFNVFLHPAFAAYLESRSDRTPYRTVRDLLEAAGATPRPAEAKAVWRYLCRPRPASAPDQTGLWQAEDGMSFGNEWIPGARDRVLNAPDTLAAIQTELMVFRQVQARRPLWEFYR